jgi:hypothetical protein
LQKFSMSVNFLATNIKLSRSGCHKEAKSFDKPTDFPKKIQSQGYPMDFWIFIRIFKCFESSYFITKQNISFINVKKNKVKGM